MTPAPGFRCEQCGYNLLGLEGDPIRCPGCGRTVSREVLEADAAGMWREHLRQARRDSAGCALFLVIAAGGLLLARVSLCAGVPLALFGAGMWLITFREVALRLSGCRGWALRAAGHQAALLAFFVVAAASLAGLAALLLALTGQLVLHNLNFDDPVLRPMGLAAIALAAVAIGVIIFGSRVRRALDRLLVLPAPRPGGSRDSWDER